jgi:hypothetical protein
MNPERLKRRNESQARLNATTKKFRDDLELMLRQEKEREDRLMKHWWYRLYRYINESMAI